MSWACDAGLTSSLVDTYQLAGPLFAQTLQSFLAAQCALVGDHLWPADVTQQVLDDPNYDFIVVGSGSAGAVVANRLSEVPEWKVLLVEAGGDPTLATEVPQLFYSNMGTKEDWGYTTQAETGACRSYKTGCAWPRGKTLGGSSSINAMFYVRGNKVDYDEWAAVGNKGWSYEEVLPYFKKSENFSQIMTEDTKKYHSTGGYLNVEKRDTDFFETIILKAAKELGIKQIDDVNGESQIGIAQTYSTTKNGARQSTARAFLSPIKERPNLHVIKNALVTKILFKPNSNEVQGISLVKDGKTVIINAKKEVILSAGSINTPQLLMLSGIGPQKHLEAMKIEAKADLPVGENLQDHLFIPLMFNFPASKEHTVSLSSITEIFREYMFKKTGPLADINPHRLIRFWNTTDPLSNIPDVQSHHLVFPPKISNMLDIYQKHGLKDEFNNKFKEINNDHFVIIIYLVLLKPKSSGKILLKSNNPLEHPLIYPNYFHENDDLKTVINGIKQYILKIKNTQTFKESGIKKTWIDLEACKSYEKESDEHLECLVRETTFSLYHPVGTAKMGPDTDKGAVLDPKLRVRKVKNLRVVDASIMPNIVRGNTNAPAIMIGEKGADLIKMDWLNAHNEL